MLQKLIEFCLANRLIVIAFALLVAVLGVRSAILLPIDAVPDMTNTQVTVITNAGSLSPIEVEQYITYPIEEVMSGLPNVEELRSVSKFGISVLTIVFKEGEDIATARQVVAERLPAALAAIPPGHDSPVLGPLTTALGEVLQFQVRGDDYSPMELRSMLDWEIVPKLRTVDGVTDVNVQGGFYKTYEIRPDPNLLNNYGITLDEFFTRVQANNGTAGGGYVVHNSEQRLIRGDALLKDLADIRGVVLKRNADGTPLLVSDVAEVELAPMTRQGAVTRDAKGEAVTGMAMMLIGENSRDVVNRIKDRLKEIEPTLAPGVKLEIIYDRSDLIGRTLHTIEKNLIEGGALVIIVLLIMLGSLRAGLIVALAIPLSMLFAANMMHMTAISASLMSLGAIDFGLIVDSSVIMVENCIHRLSEKKSERSRFEIIRDACVEVRGPTMFGEIIIAVVYVPVLMLQGTEGKLFRPMAFTVLFALLGSLIISMTLMPALASLSLPHKPKDRDIWLIRMIKLVYKPLVHKAIAHRIVTTIIALVVFSSSIPIAVYYLGAEFMPRLEEGDLLIEATRLPSASLEGAIEMSYQVESILKKYPEVKTVFCKTGRPEIANDVMGVHQTDIWTMLHEPSEWRDGMTRDKLVQQMKDDLRSQVAGVSFGFTQPIEMRVDELVAGVKSDVAVLLYGDDLQILAAKSKEIESLLKTISGAEDVKADYQGNLQTLSIIPRREALARYGVDAMQVMNAVEMLGGREAGLILEGRARFPIRIRIDQPWRSDLELLKQLPIVKAGDQLIRLSELAELKIEETPPTVEHDAVRRRTYIAVNVGDRDVASFVAEAKAKLQSDLDLPTGYEIQWGGDFQNLQSASQRLLIITPLVLFTIFLLLNLSLGSLSLSLLIFLAVPIAASGGVFALALRDMPFSISAGVGFIALFGVAVLNGLVWVSSAEHLRLKGVGLKQVTQETAMTRLRPILMTALVASMGFLPMAFSHSAGSELQRPLATVVIGGLVTSTLLTCLVIPSIYPWFVERVDLPKGNRPQEL